MKTVACVLALLAAFAATSAYAEGGADRLRERSDLLALQRQQAEEIAKGGKLMSDQQRVGRQVQEAVVDEPSG